MRAQSSAGGRRAGSAAQLTVPSWVGDLRPGASRGRSRTGAARRVARAAARAARPARRGLRPAQVQPRRARAGGASRRWLGRFVSTYGWRAYALPVLVALTGVGGVPDRHRDQRARSRRRPSGPVQGPPTIGAAGTAIIGAPPKGLDRSSTRTCRPGSCPTAARSPRPAPRPGTSCPGTDAAGRPGHRQGVHLHRRDRGRHRHHDVRRRRRLRPDGQPDAGQSEELDAQPAVRVHPDRQTANPTSGSR